MQTTDLKSSNYNTGESYGSFGYRTYVLLSLSMVYMINFLDRILISVIGRPIIDEFGLSNLQFGLLTGFGFALFYTTLGIPIARLSDRYNRVRIVGVCAILWSVATVLCGYTAGFATLLIARLAVGIGEAGCAAPSNSIISDYYKPVSRPAALGFFAAGLMVGSVLAQLAGGYVLQLFSWREAFIYIGSPGVLLGLLILFTVKEPPRGYSDPTGTTTTKQPVLKEALGQVISSKTIWLVSMAASLASVGGYSLIAFMPLYIQYTYGLSASETAISFMALFGVAGVAGTFLGGYFSRYFLQRTLRAPVLVSAFGTIAAVPLLLTGFNVSNINIMFVMFFVANFFFMFYLGPMYSVTQSVVSLRVRATAVAVLLFFTNIIGYGIGPAFIGYVADLFTTTGLDRAAASELLNATCNFNDPDLSEALRSTCLQAKSYGMKIACITASMFYVASALLFFRSGKYLLQEQQQL